MPSRSASLISRRAALVAICGAALAPRARAASDWPSKPIRLVVPFPAGGSNDVVARLLGEALHDPLGVNLVVENLGGAGGNIGAQAVARAEPDGLTFLVTTPGPLAINQFLYKSMPFDPAKAFAPVALLATIPSALIVNDRVPAKTLPELIAYLKANPDKLNYGSSGIGTTSHLFAEMFKKAAGVEIKHVPYRGGAPMAQDLISNQIQLAFPADFSLLQNQNLRALAVTSAQRVPSLPDVPTMQEMGLAGFEAVTWFALAAPRVTPAAIIERMNREVVRALARSEMATRLATVGAFASTGSPDDLASFVSSERTKWKSVIEAASISL
ncbi:Bug family tripartite tricarboxylate transporter substrate binding protein [Bosea thiooxidans]|nr:tripartite tricarboxylate transporter substrate binding protein [Bosea sp. (in: a-proteobacteria)]